MSSFPLSRPAWESTDGLRVVSGLEPGRDAPRGVRPLNVRAGAPPPRVAAVGPVDVLVVRVAGAAGGPIEVLVPAAAGLVRDPAEGARAFEGVPVREVDVLGGPLSCLVGDFAGTYC